MFERILVAEDHRSIKISVEETLKGLGMPSPEYAYWCDDALLRIDKAILGKEPFELLITDLSFDEDERPQRINNGTELIKAAKALQPHLKVLVFSGETDPAVARSLFQQLNIDGYVRKGREDTIHLGEAIIAINAGKKYLPNEFKQSIRQKNSYNFTTYELVILSQLAQGTAIKNIPHELSQRGMNAASLSSVEKSLKQMRDAFRFTKNEQLIAYCKDFKFI